MNEKTPIASATPPITAAEVQEKFEHVMAMLPAWSSRAAASLVELRDAALRVSAVHVGKKCPDQRKCEFDCKDSCALLGVPLRSPHATDSLTERVGNCAGPKVDVATGTPEGWDDPEAESTRSTVATGATPRTDEAERFLDNEGMDCASYPMRAVLDMARQIERELAEECTERQRLLTLYTEHVTEIERLRSAIHVGWIPVGERQPDQPGHYLGWDAGHGPGTVYFDDGDWKDCFGFHEAPITHWMPLPICPDSTSRP